MADTKTIYPIPSLVTLTDMGDPNCPTRGGIVIGVTPQGRYQCLLACDGRHINAESFTIVQNVATNDDSPLVAGERWRITGLTGTGSVVDAISKMAARLESLERQLLQQQEAGTNALATVAANLRAAIRTSVSGDGDTLDRVEKALTTGTVNNKPVQSQPVKAGK